LEGSWANPSPNIGIVNAVGRLLIIPRHPNNLFYNVSTPEQWVSEYNTYHDLWGGLAFDEIVDLQASILSYLLKFEHRPTHFSSGEPACLRWAT